MLWGFAQPLIYVVSTATQYGELKICILFWKIFEIALNWMSFVHCQTGFEPLHSRTERHNGYFSSGHVTALCSSNSARWRASGSDVSAGWHSAHYPWSWWKCAWTLCFYRDGVVLGNQSTGHQVHLSCICIIFFAHLQTRNVSRYTRVKTEDSYGARICDHWNADEHVKDTEYQLDICHAKCIAHTQLKQHDFITFPILSFFSYLC